MNSRMIGWCVAVLGAGSASASVPWTEASGRGSFYSWESGVFESGPMGSWDQRFGAADQFFFLGSMQMSVSNGEVATMTDCASMDLHVDPGARMPYVRVWSGVDYSVHGDGGWVQATVDVTVTSLDDPSRVLTASGSTPVFTRNSGLTVVTFDCPIPAWQDWSDIHVDARMTFRGTSVPGMSASIHENPFIIEVPGPATLALAGLGALALRRRR